MGPNMPMILPKGIVLNTDTVYDSIAQHPVLPSEAIHQCWKIYTTTHRKLRDPTARRLENCWWRIWGSDCRYLDGKVVAGLYRYISTGPTVVPIKGPTNRWEPGPDDEAKRGPKTTAEQPPEEPTNQQSNTEAVDGGNGDAKQRQPEPPQGNHATQTQDSALDASGKPRPTAARTQSEHSHNAQPVPLHPILKKERRPLGKKQVTRFAPSPPEAISAVASDASWGSVAAATHEAQGHALPSNPPPSKKKHVAVAPTKRLMAVKKRPVLPRRQSSQSSMGSDAPAATGAGGGAQRPGPVLGSPRAMPQQVMDSSTETLLEADEEGEEEAKAKLRQQKGKKPARTYQAAAASARHPTAKTTVLSKRSPEPAGKPAAAASKPAATLKPAPASKPATALKPAPASKPATASKPTPASEPAPATQPDASASSKTPIPAPRTAAKRLGRVSELGHVFTAKPLTPVPETATPTTPSTSKPNTPSDASATPDVTKSTTTTEPAPKKAISRPGPRRGQQTFPQPSKTAGPLLSSGRSRSYQAGGSSAAPFRPGSRLVSVPTAATATTVDAQGILLDLEGEAMGTAWKQPTLSDTPTALTEHDTITTTNNNDLTASSPPPSSSSGMPAPFTPTPQSRAPAVPLARTKSQLQVLLDKGGLWRSGNGGDRSKQDSRG